MQICIKGAQSAGGSGLRGAGDAGHRAVGGAGHRGAEGAQNAGEQGVLGIGVQGTDSTQGYRCYRVLNTGYVSNETNTDVHMYT